MKLAAKWLYKKIHYLSNKRTTFIMSNRVALPFLAGLRLPDDTTPRQVALARAIRRAILAGEVRHGEKLPASRMLAKSLSLSRNTVVQALDRLMAEGLIKGRHGSGTYVEARIPIVEHAMDEPTVRAALSGRARALGERRPQGTALPLTPGVPALDAFPRKIWGSLSARWARALPDSALDYGDPAGLPALRQAIALYIGASRGVVCHDEQVIITAGAQGAISSAAFLLGDPGTAILVEDPGYVSARLTLKLAGLSLKPRPVDESGMTLPTGNAARDEAGTEARLALIAPSHQYPLGITMSLERRMAVLDWVRRVDGFIIEDDYDGEYRYDTAPLPALASLDPDGNRVLYVGTLSKVLCPSLRLGFLIVPQALVEAASQVRAALDRGVPTLIQSVAADFIGEGHLGLHIRKTQALYAEKRATLIASLKAIGLTPLGSAAGLHFTVPLPEGSDARGIAKTLQARRLGGNALSAYSLDQAGTREGLVLGFANADDATARTAAELLARLAHA